MEALTTEKIKDQDYASIELQANHYNKKLTLKVRIISARKIKQEANGVSCILGNKNKLGDVHVGGL